jgi:hypothetical protein
MLFIAMIEGFASAGHASLAPKVTLKGGFEKRTASTNGVRRPGFHQPLIGR